MAAKATTPKPAGASPQGVGAGQRKPISKMEAVRRALARLGRDAKPAQMQPWIKAEFGITMSTDHISSSKGDILRKQAGKGKTAPAKAAPAAARPAAQPPAKAEAVGSRSGGIHLEDIRAVQGLLGRVGADT